LDVPVQQIPVLPTKVVEPLCQEDVLFAVFDDSIDFSRLKPGQALQAIRRLSLSKGLLGQMVQL
jgi:hypothetical protein